jgi:hypothetical protein
MRKILVSNSGLIVNGSGIKNNIGFNFGLVCSATPAMINDIPDPELIKNEVSKIRIVDIEINKSLTIPIFCILWTLRKNNSSLSDLLKLEKINSSKFSINPLDFNITGISKCGALLKSDTLSQVRRMALNDTHFQNFDKDFLSYFLYINFSGKLRFTENTNDYLKINFTRIPLLCFKSENAFCNVTSKEISGNMIKCITGKNNLNILFI